MPAVAAGSGDDVHSDLGTFTALMPARWALVSPPIAQIARQTWSGWHQLMTIRGLIARVIMECMARRPSLRRVGLSITLGQLGDGVHQEEALEDSWVQA